MTRVLTWQFSKNQVQCSWSPRLEDSAAKALMASLRAWSWSRHWRDIMREEEPEEC
jgi:hypothetical protein